MLGELVRGDTNQGWGQGRLRWASSDKCWASWFVGTRTRAGGKGVFATRLLISVGRAGSCGHEPGMGARVASLGSS